MQIGRLAYLYAAILFFSLAACVKEFAAIPDSKSRSNPYGVYRELRGDLHVHSSTGSFDAKSCQGECRIFAVTEQLSDARAAGLDFVAITEHDLNPNDPNMRMAKGEWEQVLNAVSSANIEGFIALAGYEWTSAQRSCFFDGKQTDYNHKIVILPPGATDICDSLVCKTPDQLAAFVHEKKGVIITPHPWRVELLDGNNNVTGHVSRNYFSYSDDGPGGVIIGAEIGPPFQPFAWPGLFCDRPSDAFLSRTVTIEEWLDALNAGKRLAAISSSDRHNSWTPFGSRTTLVFVNEKTREGILAALLARRTHGANLAPFHVRFSVDNQVVGSSVINAREATIELKAKAEEFDALEVWLGKTKIRTLTSLPPNGEIKLSLREVGKGPLWVKVVGREIDSATQTPRMTLTSPIWLR